MNFIDLYNACIFNYLNYNIEYYTIDEIYKIIIKDNRNILELKKYNLNPKLSKTRWKKFSPLSLYKSMCKKGIYFPFLLRNNYITFGTHRLWSIYIYNKYYKSNRIIPVINYIFKKNYIFIPNIIYTDERYDKKDFYNFDGFKGTIQYNKILWTNNTISLVENNYDNIIYLYLLGDNISKIMYEKKILFTIPEISCRNCYNKINIDNFKKNILKKLFIPENIIKMVIK